MRNFFSPRKHVKEYPEKKFCKTSSWIFLNLLGPVHNQSDRKNAKTSCPLRTQWLHFKIRRLRYWIDPVSGMEFPQWKVLKASVLIRLSKWFCIIFNISLLFEGFIFLLICRILFKHACILIYHAGCRWSKSTKT